MRYHTEPQEIETARYGRTYVCDHPVYTKCTLFKMEDRGLAVIQQRYTPGKKTTSWGPIDPWLCDILYTNKNFMKYFNERAGVRDKNKIYPTVTIRQIMWALKIKPLKKERWETCFDRKEV